MAALGAALALLVCASAGGAAPAGGPPRASMRIATGSVAALRRTGHLVVRVHLDARGNGALVARIHPGRIRSSAVVHGFPRAGRATFVLRISRRARRLLAGGARVTVALTLAVEDMAARRRRTTVRRTLPG